uniref:Uncharacterized protein n=1 Tax=Chromera velia CCMP2878 TaxID=1169474 RepID=A0A0G4GNJ0_9ALVE|eukprot:Cvel_4974.t1-p1 / transcript=Cvel_4974.t1 / gene=Cvel_4974 / organism=Chromera_velia_CCMP2878 / gene_product=hypothetical protein / transcript_product=hypothetical protein / location=Cvel_scaffold225:13659-14992(-) / protein_length=134 / sequence_SO=supercontig / SO=protein_coding / is_pseudo=false
MIGVLDRKGKLADLVAIAGSAALKLVADKATNAAGVYEQGFSLYDQVYSEKRNRLTQPHQDLLVTTHANLPNLHLQRVHQRNVGHYRRETQILGIQGLDLVSDESVEVFDDELDGEMTVEYLKSIGLKFREALF